MKVPELHIVNLVILVNGFAENPDELHALLWIEGRMASLQPFPLRRTGPVERTGVMMLKTHAGDFAKEEDILFQAAHSTFGEKFARILKKYYRKNEVKKLQDNGDKKAKVYSFLLDPSDLEQLWHRPLSGGFEIMSVQELRKLVRRERKQEKKTLEKAVEEAIWEMTPVGVMMVGHIPKHQIILMEKAIRVWTKSIKEKIKKRPKILVRY